MKLRAIVADDELLARRRLVRLLGELRDVEVVAECVDGEEALARIRATSVDLVLLDIQMPGLTGLDALDALGPEGPSVILCTAHEVHAVAAFSSGAVDYLLKPIELERLRKAVDRVRGRGRRVERLPLETRGGVVLVDPARVTHAELDGALVTLTTLDGAYVTELSLQELERRLPSCTRVHRRALLALEHVVRLEPVPSGGYAAHTVRGHVVEVSRQAARDLRRRLGLAT